MDADLIVIATHGHTGLKHFLLGSTAERVVRFAPCPVLSAREQLIPVRFPETTPLRFTKILVPVDFSEASRKALPYAVSLAREFGAGLRLLHVVEPSAYYPFDQAHSKTMEAQLTKRMSARLDLMLQSYTIDATTQVRVGSAFQEIVQEAADQNADLIVLSTHGHSGLKHVFLGSTAEGVVRHAACPVLVVREKGHGFVPA
jgi:nucleotide-binding universal stress UspA family protein